MQVVQIRRETKSLNRAANVLLDMRSLVRHSPGRVLAQAVEAALRGNEDLVSDVVLADEVAEELLVHAGCVDDLDVSVVRVITPMKCKLGALTAVSQKVQPSSMAFKSTGSACSRVRLFPKPKLMPMAPKPGVGTSMSANGSVLTILSRERISIWIRKQREDKKNTAIILILLSSLDAANEDGDGHGVCGVCEKDCFVYVRSKIRFEEKCETA